MKEFDKMIHRRSSRTQRVEDIADLDLLVSGRDVLEVRRTNHPDYAPEYFLYITKGKKNLFLWGTGHGSKLGENYGRVVKLPLEEIDINGGAIKIPAYNFNIFFNLNENSYVKLREAGLLI
ncbi:hypothetical protein HYW20_09040 [Candidatus Woesearchaeota archaeon]|nr:hypothetical protein [Candidatus Woesearchaeota archaeon]